MKKVELYCDELYPYYGVYPSNLRSEEFSIEINDKLYKRITRVNEEFEKTQFILRELYEKKELEQ